MPTNTGYGFPYPTSNEPVANGAANIQSLASTVDLKMGLHKIIPTSAVNASVSGDGDVTFSAVSPVSVNGAFSSLFQSYRIIFSLAGSVGGSFANFRLRAAGVDLQTANYYRYGYTTAFGSGSLATYNAAAQTQHSIVGQWGGGLVSTCIMDISDPQTTNRAHWSDIVNDTGAGAVYNQSAVVDVTTSYDGFTIFANAGNMTGSIRIYGYRN